MNDGNRIKLMKHSRVWWNDAATHYSSTVWLMIRAPRKHTQEWTVLHTLQSHHSISTICYLPAAAAVADVSVPTPSHSSHSPKIPRLPVDTIICWALKMWSIMKILFLYFLNYNSNNFNINVVIKIVEKLIKTSEFVYKIRTHTHACTLHWLLFYYSVVYTNQIHYLTFHINSLTTPC